MDRWRRGVVTGTAVALMGFPQAMAGDLLVHVEGVANARGAVLCTLFGKPEEFPFHEAPGNQRSVPARPPAVDCAFKGLPAGKYAVAVGHDINGNHDIDTNFLGIPTEPWGLSNNVRPALSVPRFSEVAVPVPATGVTSITITLKP